ncbi:hypothetical protein [Agrococcus beijingensis]|uniref:hypothetical protein n=1 Tax=Agrococcus beijingensis TaxID=3068634 RepID=UPI002741D65E|nr:hypothetical protein [Agrococcus sp. REN33]
MEFAEHDGPMPDPPTLATVGAEFPALLVTLVPQPGIREIGVNTAKSGNDGTWDYEQAAIMYAVFWNPDDLDDPMNHVELAPELEEALENPSPRLSGVAREWMQWMRFPIAYEAVQTHVPRESLQSLPERLAMHMRNVIANTFRQERHPVVHEPSSFIDPPSADDARPASVIVDGVELPAVSIDDEHVVGVGVELDDAVATVVIARHLLPLLRLELTRRPRP